MIAGRLADVIARAAQDRDHLRGRRSLDLLAFEPRSRTPGNWQDWQSHSGARVARGGPGSMMYVPRGCPHAFANPGPGPARMIFLVSPAGHEHYQKELAELVASTTGPLDAAIAQLRARHDIEQLTPQVIPGAHEHGRAPLTTAVVRSAGACYGAGPGRTLAP